MNESKLNLNTAVLGYSDEVSNAAPNQRDVDWKRSLQGIPVSDLVSAGPTLLPNEARLIFSGVRATGIAADTQFTLSLKAGSSSSYRFTHTSGTAPALRTARALATSGVALTVTQNANMTATIAGPAATFTAVQVGDTVFVPGVSTGDPAGPFDPTNEGYWVVLAVATDGSSMQLVRPDGTSFSAISEVKTPTANTQVQAFSAAGVQVGDAVDISAGFPVTVQKTFEVTAVNPEWFEITSTAPLPVSVVATPGVSGMTFYTNAKRYVRIETQQDIVIRYNGDASNNNRISPWVAGDPAQPGWDEHVGPVWALTIVNRTAVPCKLHIITAE